jgi:hypothetical protein
MERIFSEEVYRSAINTLVTEASKRHPDYQKIDTQTLQNEFIKVNVFTTPELAGLSKEVKEGRFHLDTAKELDAQSIRESIQHGMDRCTSRQKVWTVEDYEKESVINAARIIVTNFLRSVPDVSEIYNAAEIMKSKYSSNSIIELSEAVKNNTIHIRPSDKIKSLSGSIEKGIEDFNIQNSRKASFEDIVERAHDKGLNLPKDHMEYIRTSIEQNKAPPELFKGYIDKIADKRDEKGFGWHIREDRDPKYPLLRFMDKHGTTLAYIVERTNTESGQKFYAANRINENKEHIKITSNNSIEAVKNHVNAYYTGAIIRELSNEKSLNKTPLLNIPDLNSSKYSPSFDLTR